jgi:kynureninase
MNRRQLLKSAAIGGPALLASSQALAASTPAAAEPALMPNSIAVADLPGHFDVEPGYHNLEAGYWSMMPRVVAQAFARHTLDVNRANAIYARNVLPGGTGWTADARAASAAIAGQVGCSPDEIAVTRSGSDALQMLIANYKGLKPGDGVIHCDLDYDSTICAMEWLGTHKQANVVRFAMPEPATTANILTAYDDVLKRTPTAKLLLVTQVSNRTGLVTPVREIVAMARARGVDTIVDAAHGIALLDFQLDDLGADFVGWSVHKWTSAPLGTGAMYIRKDRIADIDIAYENTHIDPAQHQRARARRHRQFRRRADHPHRRRFPLCGRRRREGKAYAVAAQSLGRSGARLEECRDHGPRRSRPPCHDHGLPPQGHGYGRQGAGRPEGLV